MLTPHQEASKKTILVVEDDVILNRFLQKNLENKNYNVQTLSNGEGIPKAVERNQFHLILLDIELPGKDGIYWLKWLKNYHPFIPTIIVSAKAMPIDRVHGLEAGAHDYLIKPFLEQELFIKIEALFAEGAKQTKHLLSKSNAFSIDTLNNQVIKEGKAIPLTKQECKLLQLFYMNEGIPLSRDELSMQTTGMHYIPHSRTIDIHINRLRIKIEDNPSKPSYIRTIRGKGYCFYLPEL